MLGYGELIVVLLPLLAVRVTSDSQGEDGVHQLCQSKEVSFPLNASEPINVTGCVGTTLSIKGLPSGSVCSLHRGLEAVLTRSPSMVLPAGSGIYTLNCSMSNGSQTSQTLSLRILKRPSPPRFDFLPRGSESSPQIRCVSESSPVANVSWYNSLQISGKEFFENPIKTSNRELVHKTLMCCAVNDLGTECTQLYDYDLSGTMEGLKNQEAAEVILSPGQSLLLRCSTTQRTPKLRWSTEGRPGMITKLDRHKGHQMAYLYMESVTVEQAGTYTCVGSKNKSTSIQVLAEGFISISLDLTNRTISPKEAIHFCLQASISSLPVPDYCAWEHPNGVLVDCGQLSWRNGTRTLCGQKRSGEYKLHLQVANQRVRKRMALCVADTPQISCRSLDGVVWCETVSPVPSSVSWKLCQGTNGSCTEIPEGSYQIHANPENVEDLFCETRINSSMMTSDLPTEDTAQFCLTNSFGYWCSDHQHLRHPLLPSPVRVFSPVGGGATELKTGFLVLLGALVLIGLLVLYTIRRKPRYKSQLQMIQMMGPNENDYIYINFKDFEYDQKWEFPRENLQLGKELGSGAFGMVVQATAVGLGNQGTSQVAVKMLKEKHQTVEKEALMSELKMMTQVGNHDNIINLLGACTGTGPTYLIFQFCWYGDLLNYLKKNRECYHKSLTDAFNEDRFSSLYHNLQSKTDSSESQTPVDNYVQMHPFATGGHENLALLNPAAEGICQDSGGQPEESESLTYNDLLSFAQQVAMGMEFLSSKNCIHRDLAARNVLVTQDRLVKIGDFGLARDIDNDSNYVVRGNVRLPVKWMAPESIFHGMYTMKSDIWAYGILLWEIFSLGVTPYPGVKVDNKFYSMIKRGFQMECPYYAGDSVYRIMCQCWNLEPGDRPAFSKLVAFMGDQLTTMEEKLYHNTVEERSSDYINESAILDISSPQMKEEEAPRASSHNDYCQRTE